LVKRLVHSALALGARERLLTTSLVVGGLVLLGRLTVDEVRDGRSHRGSGIGDSLHVERRIDSRVQGLSSCSFIGVQVGGMTSEINERA
jgi:hypothetical protein